MHLTQTDARRISARRGQLHLALVELEECLSRPVGDRVAWCDQVRAGLEHLAWTLANHVDETEAPGGLLHEVESVAPWLAPRVAQLRRDHELVVDRTASLLERCHGEFAPDEVRERVLELIGELARHRHRGADLLYDAYQLDVGVGD